MESVEEAIKVFRGFLGINTTNEVRPDSVGALRDEVEHSERRIFRYGRSPMLRDSMGMCEGIFIYDFKKETEKYFRHRSAGRLKNAG